MGRSEAREAAEAVREAIEAIRGAVGRSEPCYSSGKTTFRGGRGNTENRENPPDIIKMLRFGTWRKPCHSLGETVLGRREAP